MTELITSATRFDYSCYRLHVRDVIKHNDITFKSFVSLFKLNTYFNMDEAILQVVW